MPQVITPQNKPLFAKKNDSQEKDHFFQNKRELFIVLGLFVFILVVLGVTFFFLGLDYSKQLAEKSSFFIPFLRKKN